MLTQMDCFGMTDLGRVRPSNQDHYLIADLNKSLRIQSTSLSIDDETRIYSGSQGKLLLVADGMGGEAAGERASTIAVDQLATYVLNSLSWYYRLEEDSEHDFEEHLKEAIESCQDSIRQVANQRSETANMGTTMTMVYIVWPRAFVVHVGDSRCYLLRHDQLQQVTVDHTVANLMAESGKITQEEARHAPHGNALWNALGGKSEDLSIDVYKLSLDRGDVLLLCTDGLYDMLSNEQLKHALCSQLGAEAACRNLVEMANDIGGLDNITVIVAQFRPPSREEQRKLVEIEALPDEVDRTRATVGFEPLGITESVTG